MSGFDSNAKSINNLVYRGRITGAQDLRNVVIETLNILTENGLRPLSHNEIIHMLTAAADKYEIMIRRKMN